MDRERGPAVSGPQVAFSVALGLLTLVITGFALYAASSTMWGGRWYGRGPQPPPPPPSPEARAGDGSAGR